MISMMRKHPNRPASGSLLGPRRRVALLASVLLLGAYGGGPVADVSEDLPVLGDASSSLTAARWPT